jgi:hypothetical protein
MKKTNDPTKYVTKNRSDAVSAIWPGRSELRPEPRYDGPQGQEIDLEYQRRMNTNDGKWTSPGMGEKQPRSGPGKYMDVHELGVMPEDVLQPGDKPEKVKAKISKVIAAVESSQWNYNTDGKQPLERPQ